MHIKKASEWISKNYIIITLIVLAAIARLVLIFRVGSVGWDDAVYVGMAKYIFSFGHSGFWEPIRPIVWPAMLGIGWVLRMDVVLFGKVISLFFSIGSIILVYLIADRIYGKAAAAFSAIMLSFSAIFFFLNYGLLTEIPAVFFLLLGFYLFLGKKWVAAGVFIAISGITRYPFLIFLIIFCAYLLVLSLKKTVGTKDFVRFALGISAVLVPFFLMNIWLYSSPIYPLAEANSVIGKVLGCNYLYKEPAYFYFRELMKENIFYLLFAVGAVYSFGKKARPEQLLVLVLFLMPFAYLQSLDCKSYRYALMFLPFLIMLSAYGIKILLDRLRLNSKKILLSAGVILLVYAAYSALLYYNANNIADSRPHDYDDYQFGNQTTWVSSPWHSLYSDCRLNLIYYPVYDSARAQQIYTIVENGSGIEFLIDDCPMSISCWPGDTSCQEYRNLTLGILENRYALVYNRTFGECSYLVYSR
jgi:4-amino-4-deoxy-L-arabinose transferase-like glycosyltransferase